MLSSNRMAEIAKPQTSSSLANGFAAIVLLQVTLECSSGSNVGKMMDCREQHLLMTAMCCMSTQADTKHDRSLLLTMRRVVVISNDVQHHTPSQLEHSMKARGDL